MGSLMDLLYRHSRAGKSIRPYLFLFFVKQQRAEGFGGHDCNSLISVSEPNQEFYVRCLLCNTYINFPFNHLSANICSTH